MPEGTGKAVMAVTGRSFFALLVLLLFAPAAEALVLRVGASPVPHGELLQFVAPDLASQGIDVEIVLYEDYVGPNRDLVQGRLDANYFQNRLYLDGYNRDYGTDLVPVGSVHFERMGLYSSRYRSLGELPAGALVVHPSDSVNRGRAFHLLEDAGLIRLLPNVSLEAGPFDVADNPRKLRFQAVAADRVMGRLADAALVVANCNYALEAGLDPARESLFEERVEPLFHNIVVVRRDDAGRREIALLVSALRSAKARDFMALAYGGAVTPVF